jgi:hypothetical protein
VRTENRLNARNDIFHDEREMLGWRAKKMGVYKTKRERYLCLQSEAMALLLPPSFLPLLPLPRR